MIRQLTYSAYIMMVVEFATLPATSVAQQPPYDVFPAADPPYYRVRHEASTVAGELM